MSRIRRIEPDPSRPGNFRATLRALSRPGEIWAAVRSYVGIGGHRKAEPVVDPASLARFLQTRSSFIAQTSLYGYVRTRAGMRYPELFDDDAFVGSLNIAKWQVWLACLSDLTVYAGGLLARAVPGSSDQVGKLMRECVEGILEETGVPSDAGPQFTAGADAVRVRIAACSWELVTDDAGPFTESPPAVIGWAPIVDSLKELDEHIVLNSVRFRWQEIRRELRGALDADAVLGVAAEPRASAGEAPSAA